MRISTNMFHNQGFSSIQTHQKNVLDNQLQLSSGKRVNVASDDPVAAPQIQALKSTMSTIDQYARNGDYAKSQLVQEETAITDTITSMQRARELTLQVMNGSYSEENRKAAAVEVGQLIQHISNEMNYTNSEGEKLFAGNSVNAAAAFVDDVVNPGYKAYIANPNAGSATAVDARYDVNDNYDPLAGYGSRHVQIGFDVDSKLEADDFGDSSRVRVSDNGGTVFGITNGVTQFKTALPYAKEIIDPNAVESADLKFYPMTEGQSITVAGLTYTANSAMTADEVAAAYSNLADGAVTGSGTATGTYSGTLTDWASGAVTDSNHLTFVSTTGAVGEDVADITVSHTDLYPPENNALNILVELKRDLENNDTSDMQGFVKDMDSIIEQMSYTRSEIGGRQNRISAQYDAGETFKIALEARRSNLEDMDFVKGVAELTKNQNALQVAQQVFSKVQELSLFSYLR